MDNKKLKILAIDDNRDNLIIIKALVNEAFPEASVYLALDGIKGIEMAIAENPDVILLDIIMPLMDGFEVCQMLKADKKLNDIPVVFVTALKGDRESRIRALESGAEAFLAKPIDLSELTAQIRAMVKIKAANTEKHNEKVRLSALVEERTRELKETHFATLNLLEDLRKENYIRKKSEEALRQSEERFRAVAQSANDAIITTDSYGIILGWNRGAQIIFGYTEEEITGKNLEIIMPQPYAKSYNENHQVKVKDTISHNIGKTVELYGLRNDRNEFPLELSLAEWETASGKYYTGIIRDITERKQSELLIQKRSEELRIAKDHAEQSDRLKSAFLANMRHEIRTPMNGILGFSALLKEPNLTGEEKLQYISVIEKAGTRMLNIINDIIDISKIEAGLMELNIGESDINEQIEYI